MHLAKKKYHGARQRALAAEQLLVKKGLENTEESAEFPQPTHSAHYRREKVCVPGTLLPKTGV